MSYDVLERTRLNLRDYYFYIRSISNRTSSSDIKILCNSYPKSGTHLLSQILVKLPNVVYWDDIVSVQSLSGVMNTKKHIKWKLGSSPKNAMIKSHLMFDENVIDILDDGRFKKFFIYRDLRDVVCSHANWVMNEERIYLNGIYKQLSSNEERLMASIKGTPIGSTFGSNCSQPDIATDFSRWKGWLDDPDTLAVKFEDLVGSRGGGDDVVRHLTLKRIIEHLGLDFSDDYIEETFSLDKLNPNASHTFRKGQKGSIGTWKSKFNEDHKHEFKRVAGDLLIELGYEEDLNW